MTLVNDAFSYVGKSLYQGDPYPDLTLDEFRIYSGALTAAEIAATQALGSSQLLSNARPFLSAVMGPDGLTLFWPAASAGFTLQTSPNLQAGSWTIISNPVAQLVGTQWRVTFPKWQTAQYFRLSK